MKIFYMKMILKSIKDKKVNVLEKFDEGYSGAKFREAKL